MRYYPGEGTKAESRNKVWLGFVSTTRMKQPLYLRKSRKFASTLWRRLTSRIRVLPDFLIVGAQKSGTTTLFHYLIQHPNIIRPITKEIDYFDINYTRGLGWYRTHFHTFYSKSRLETTLRGPVLTGEASTHYIAYPHAPKRAYQLTPKAKIIMLLRNPADRAYSSYQHQVRKNRETLSFEEALQQEPERIRGEWDKILRDECYVSYNRLHLDYVTRGVYIDQIKRWREYFPQDQIMTILSEEFFQNPNQVFGGVLRFLGLPQFELQEYHISNEGIHHTQMDPHFRERLIEYYRPHNKRLEEYLGKPLHWK